jgi:hypothetical protein
MLVVPEGRIFGNITEKRSSYKKPFKLRICQKLDNFFHEEFYDTVGVCNNIYNDIGEAKTDWLTKLQ